MTLPQRALRPAPYDPLGDRDRRLEQLLRQLGRAFERISNLEARVFAAETALKTVRTVDKNGAKSKKLFQNPRPEMAGHVDASST